jgi:hypothetical protein
MKLTTTIALVLCATIPGCATDATSPAVETAASSLAAPPPVDLTCEPFDESYCDPSAFCEVTSLRERGRSPARTSTCRFVTRLLDEDPDPGS